MINPDTQKILEAINGLRSSYDTWKVSADNDQVEIDKYTKSKADCVKYMNELELKIDQQYLILRKIMNGESSAVPVDPPSVAEPVQIGRED